MKKYVKKFTSRKFLALLAGFTAGIYMISCGALPCSFMESMKVMRDWREAFFIVIIPFRFLSVFLHFILHILLYSEFNKSQVFIRWNPPKIIFLRSLMTEEVFFKLFGEGTILRLL